VWRLIDFWALVSVLIVFGGGLIAFLRWLDGGRRSLLMKKKALLDELQDQLEKNPSIGRAVAFLKQSDVEKKLGHLFAAEASLLTEAEVTLKHDLDAFFLVLDRIAHAVSVTGILTREESEVFSWYFRLIQHHPILGQYFYNSGFLDLWDFAQSLMEKLGGDEVEV
jgi:hypothetical protein